MPTSAPDPDCSSVVRPARRIAFVLLLLTLGALGALTASALPTLAKAVVAPAVAFYGLRSARQLLDPPIHRMSWDGESLVLQDAKGECARYDRRSRAFVCPVFIGLMLGSDSVGQRSLGVFRNQTDAEFWRQTMIRIRAQGVAGAD